MDETRKSCFVVGPIGGKGSDTRKHADFLLNGIIRPAFEGKIDLKIWRADEDNRPGMITDKVISDILYSDVVVADLSELNPNAFYELGIRHAASLPTIHMACEGTKLPFDNIGYRAIMFDKGDWNSVVVARSMLLAQMAEALDTSYRVSNPVTQAVSAVEFRASAEPRDQIVAELMRRVAKIEDGTKYISLEQSRRPLGAERRHVAQAYDILVDVAENIDFDYEKNYLVEAASTILSRYPIGYLEDLHDKARFIELGELLEKYYIPF